MSCICGKKGKTITKKKKKQQNTKDILKTLEQ